MTASTPERFDVLIIGVGQAGKPLALAFAKEGHTVALIERHFVGGSCINYGCTPTKTLLASAQMAHLARRSSEYGVETGDVRVRFDAVIERKNKVVEQFRSGIKDTLSETENLTLIRGEARFSEEKTVQVTDSEGNSRTLTADRVFINTGSHPTKPPIEGIDSVEWLNSTTIMDLEELPEHLLIVGGSYIGVEFSQMFRRFGSKVTMLVREAQLMEREDPDVVAELASVLTGEGIQIHYNTQVTKIAKSGSGGITLQLDTEEPQKEISGSHLLLAVGTTPNTKALNLEAAGIQADEDGFVAVNDRLETNQSGVYALGDVKGGPAFTHISYDDYRVVKQNLLGKGNATTKGRPVPYTLFTEPQLGRIGLSEKKAREEGKNIKIAKMPVSHVARAIEMSRTEGLMKVVIDVDTDQLLGVAMLCPEGGELMSLLQVAMMGNLTYQQLRDAIFAHPTLAESFNNLFTQLD